MRGKASNDDNDLAMNDNMGAEPSFNSTQGICQEILDDEPLGLNLPKKGNAEKVFHIFMFPIIALLWLTMNWFDVRKNGKWFIISYILSIVWMCIFDYLLVWWTSTAGAAFGVPPLIIGMVFLGLVFAFPALYLTTKTAKHGLGDMVFSFISGMNIFKMTIRYT